MTWRSSPGTSRTTVSRRISRSSGISSSFQGYRGFGPSGSLRWGDPCHGVMNGLPDSSSSFAYVMRSPCRSYTMYSVKRTGVFGMARISP